MFPLENPDASKEENDNLLERQFLFLEKLLADQCPDVRITAVQGVCRILRLFWEVIPSGITVKLLSKIVDDIAHDNSSSTVRCAVLQGITYLLENPASHDLLKAIITKLGPLLNDCNLSVRIEMANMLLALKGIRTISFLKVSSLESLLSALECDKPPVARRLTRLLIPSYFPSKVSLEEACNRCVALIKRAPQSGVRFCEWALQEGVPASSLLELVKVLCNLVGSPDALKDEEKEGIFAALNELCHKLANQKELKVSLGEILTRDMLKALLMNATTSKSRTSIIEMVSVINPTDVPELFVYCSQVVSNFSKDTLNPINCNEARSVHSLMLAWGGFNDLVKTLIRNFAQVSKLDERFGWPRSAVKSLKKKKLESKSPWTKSMKGKVSVAKARKDVTVTGLAEDLRNALCAAWHAENLVEVEEMRQALLVDENLPALLSGLRNTVHFVFHSGIEIPVPDFLKASPLRAYATLAVHMTLNEKTGKRARDARESGIDHRNPVDYVCEELIQWAENLQSLPKLSSPISHKKRQVKHSRSLRTPCRGALTDISNGSSSCTKDSTAERCSEAELFVSKGKILNTLLESLLYFLSLNLVKDEALQYKCLEFAKKLMEWLLNCLRMWDTLGAKNKVSGVIGKDSLLCTRMCTAHCGKMLYVTLRKNTEGALKSADLSNCLLDSIFFSESVFGGKGAMSLFTSLNPWFPDVFISISSWATDLILNDLSADVSCLCFDDLVQLGNKSLKPWVVNLLTAASETYSQHGDQPGCPMAEDECTYGENAQEIEDAFQPAMDQNFSFSSEMLKRMSNLLCNGDPVVLGGILNLFLWHAAASLQTKNYAVVVGAVQIACRSIHSCKLFSEGAQSKQHLWEQFVAACEVMITQINVISDKKDSLPQLDSKALLRVKDLVQNLLASERR
ncbi:hypothetical protein KP509_25G025200 [Ceratopteris richardii]|nr:hypothetical protein KP509_25G025200 [Ceratopteris richardii]